MLQNACNNVTLPMIFNMTDTELIEYLQTFGIIHSTKYCNKTDSCQNKLIVIKPKKYRDTTNYYFYCRSCRTNISVRSESEFLSWNGNKNRLSLKQIVQIVYAFVNQSSVSSIMHELNLSEHTVYEWLGLCRDVCFIALERAELMGGADELIQAQESLMLGNSRKYHRGRITPGEVEARASKRKVNELKNSANKAKIDDDDGNTEGDDDDDESDESMHNYGMQIEGNWVFGIAHWRLKEWQIEHRSGCETRFFYVRHRNAETLLPLFQRHVHADSIIFIDQWKAYYGLSTIGFAHHTINHSEHFVDPVTLVNTQLIESAWRNLRLRIVKCARNVGNNLPKHLAEYWWRSLHKDPTNKNRPHDNIFEKILSMI